MEPRVLDRSRITCSEGRRVTATDGFTRRKLHVALGVCEVDRCVVDYSTRLGCPPAVHIPGEYALWHSEEVNLSIRRAEATGLRHLGWEDPSAAAFSVDTDVNGILWERFAAEHQAAEIRLLWPIDAEQ
jgi:hypothetical protein